jgi:NAD(P)-dependent dehydrogenase (short-subunit alcohol dehydrogenase family)
MRAAGGGRIVNIASDVTFYGPPRLLHYVSSKGAVVAMTRGMARDAGPDHITVNAVAPGITETEATRSVPAERHELFRINRALTRPQQPEDVTGAVRFLLSDAAAYITGQTLLVDGGFVCR